MRDTTWITCPTCNSKTRIKILPDTKIDSLPLYCPKCKQENVISVCNLKIIVNNK